ncbi:hypothetical protein DXC97_07125 [Lachnospiraceae bacterium TF09-5]|nr:hypothetical protein DXC97_07125 [Lachnospiraceae bacterium TF09-5]
MIPADVLKAVFLKQFGGYAAFGKDRVGNAFYDKLGKFRLDCFLRHTIEGAAFLPHLEVLHILGKYLRHPLAHQFI